MENLVAQAKYDQSAFSELYRMYVKNVYSFFYSYLRDKQDAEDLTSQTWEVVLRKISDLRSDEIKVFKVWLFRIAKNNLNKFFFKKKITSFINIDDQKDLLPSKEPSPYEVAYQKETSDEILKYIHMLPDKQRSVILLRYSGGLKNYEIAEVLKMSEINVASNISRGLSTLKNHLTSLKCID
ncbi:MAG: sigma-70 family RNA polymerase sigma factor [Candidatus Gracilibacteria bacterium]